MPFLKFSKYTMLKKVATFQDGSTNQTNAYTHTNTHTHIYAHMCTHPMLPSTVLGACISSAQTWPRWEKVWDAAKWGLALTIDFYQFLYQVKIPLRYVAFPS